jgi:hypothetical protein
MRTKKSTGQKSIVGNEQPEGERVYLSPGDVQKWVKSQVIDAYVKELGGYVRARLIGADKFMDFLKKQKGEDAERLESMSQLISETLCNEDGSDYITKEEAITYPISVLDDIIGAVAQARKEARGNA